MIEIKIPQKIAWTQTGNKWYARILVPAHVVENSFLKLLSPNNSKRKISEVQAEYKISDGAVEIRFTPKKK